MLRIKLIQRLFSLIKRKTTYTATTSPTTSEEQPTSKVLASNVEEEAELDERLGTDDLFFASEHLPFTVMQQHEQIFPKAKPTLLDPLIDETQRVDKSGVCAVPFSQIPAIGGHLWLELCHLFSKCLYAIKGQNDEKLLSWIYPFRIFFDFYGPLVRINTPSKSSVVMLCKPKHILAVQKYDGTHSLRSIIDSMENYRRTRISITMPQYEIDFSQVAEKFKNHLNHRVNDYQYLCNQMAVDFVKRNYLIRDHRCEVPANYNGELCLWSLKCFSAIVFGRDAEYKQDGYTKIVHTLIEVSKALSDCESAPQIWRFLPTTSTSKLAQCFDVLETLLIRNLRMTYLKLGKLSKNVKNETPQPVALLETMILKDKMSTDCIITTLMDLLVVGVNSIANIAGMVLYYLSKSPDVQDRLFWEINLVIPHDLNELFSEDMIHLPLLRACIVETMRLWPPFTHTVRCTSKEIVVNGYTIPKNTNVIMAHQIAFHKNEHFADAKKFEPRRWIGRFSKQLDPLEVMPFCHRQHPIIKELAYRQIAVLIAHMVKNFEIEYNYGEMSYESKILSLPSKPLKFTLKDRH
ncbi:probable cytochrome P450 49a1 [Cimex lectularius]|uniref:Cytochrome P450 n=1 Tax=Cimex lectularius TaxID=79782 RepID=A0A8I6S3Q0_CIMLE|nr:probable cytochrome P450 49a1 [Cimex lectularius]